MSNAAYIGVNGVARKVKEIDYGVNNVARKVKKGYIGVNNVARLFYTQADIEPIRDLNIGSNISNGYIYGGKLWVYSFSSQKLYGVSLTGGQNAEIPVTSQSTGFSELVSPLYYPLCLSIAGGSLFLTQRRTLTQKRNPTNEDISVLTAANFTGSESSITLSDAPVVQFYHDDNENYLRPGYNALPYVQSITVDGKESYYMAIGDWFTDWGNGAYYLTYCRWNDEEIVTKDIDCWDSFRLWYYFGFNNKNNKELLYFFARYSSGRLESFPKKLYSDIIGYSDVGSDFPADTNTPTETPTAGINQFYFGGAANRKIYYAVKNKGVHYTDISGRITLPTGSTAFIDASAYCVDKDMWFFFLGTGLLYTSDLANADAYGFLNTTDEIGTITRCGYMDYDETTHSLIIIGQETSGRVRVARIGVSTF